MVTRPARLLAAPAVLLAAVVVAGPTAAAPTSRAQGADDPIFVQGLQWGLERIGAPAAWRQATGEGITIAIIDSGADLDHEDLAGQIVGSASCLDAAGDPDRCDERAGAAQDQTGHGTHVAGIAAATTGNGRGVASVAPDARLLVVEALTADCEGCTASGTAGDVAAGIRWAVEHGADVINLSLGGGAVQSITGCGFCDAIEEAWAAGVVAVVAAGNDTALPSGFGREHAVVVVATTREDGRASYSNTSSGLLREARWPVAAPGGESDGTCGPDEPPRAIISTYPDAYACLSGTSMAAPHVSGALAVLLSQGRSPAAAIDRLLATAEDLGPPGRDAAYGEGRIDLARAVGAAPTRTTATSSASQPPATDAPTSEVSAAPAVTAAPTTPAPVTTAPPPTVSDDLAAPSATPGPDPDDDDVPLWLIAVAVLTLLGSAVGTATRAAHRWG